ncbi:MAG: hypothetical protein A2075_17060 [Geobacteraceae bacterium GWC2_58_44]|nr:MAG: hypothetical protein A2075_17060 [Geobacteraceae bacterium GWC2_58_44]HBG07006.1 hypothetical protein [Geobacter sp.]
MSTQTNTTVRMFGALHSFRKDRGLASTIEVAVPPEGRTALDLAQQLSLPMDKVEAVFINHVVHDLGKVVKPGDRVAFIPTGIPGPARFLLGINGKGQQKAA